MAIIQASAGHSRPQERKVANWLYISISMAVVLAGAIFLILSHKTPLNPTHLDQKAPETNPSQY